MEACINEYRGLAEAAVERALRDAAAAAEGEQHGLDAAAEMQAIEEGTRMAMERVMRDAEAGAAGGATGENGRRRGKREAIDTGRERSDLLTRAIRERQADIGMGAGNERSRAPRELLEWDRLFVAAARLHGRVPLAYSSGLHRETELYARLAHAYGAALERQILQGGSGHCAEQRHVDAWRDGSEHDGDAVAGGGPDSRQWQPDCYARLGVTRGADDRTVRIAYGKMFKMRELRGAGICRASHPR